MYLAAFAVRMKVNETTTKPVAVFNTNEFKRVGWNCTMCSN